MSRLSAVDAGCGGAAAAGPAAAGRPGRADGRGGAGEPRRLRVALVAPPYFEVPPAGYGGVEAVVACLADALVAAGHAVTVVGAGKPGTAAGFVPVWERPVPERLGEPFPEVMHAAAARRAVQRLAAAGELDVVHDHTLAGPLNAAAFAALGVPVVATVHGPAGGELRRYYAALGPEVHLVAVSDRQRELAPELNWAGTVHNAVRVADWPFRARKRDYAVFLGRFCPDKAPHLALEAAHAAGLPLVLAGKCAEPAERAYFEREVRPRLSGRDRLAGVADAAAKRRLLAGARCLLFPVCWEEPFGMVMIEAMACGTPVVALRAGAVPEVVAHGVTGLICDRPGELPAALREVTRIDPAACRAHVAANFSAEAMARGYAAVYRRVLARAAALPPAALDRVHRDRPAVDADLRRHHQHGRSAAISPTAAGWPAGRPRRAPRAWPTRSPA